MTDKEKKMDKENNPNPNKEEETQKPEEAKQETSAPEKEESKPDAEAKAPAAEKESKPEAKAPSAEKESKPEAKAPSAAKESGSKQADSKPTQRGQGERQGASTGHGAPPEGAGGGGRGRRGKRGGREGGRRGGPDGRDRQESEWEEKIIQVRRVTKVVKGGKKLSFRAVVAVGNGKGQVGIGIGKASEVIMAIQKGIADARKSLVNVPIIKTTIPHEIIGKQGSSRVLLKPAAKGTGVIAGGATRAVLELAGIGDVMSKSLGSRSPLNVARATVNGLNELRTFEQAANLRGITVKQMLS